MIIQMYKDIFARNPALFALSDNSYTLSPLSTIFAKLFDEMDFDERILCLKMLGSDSIDRYTEEFVQKLYDNYTQPFQIENLLSSGDPEQFI